MSSLWSLLCSIFKSRDSGLNSDSDEDDDLDENLFYKDSDADGLPDYVDPNPYSAEVHDNDSLFDNHDDT